MIVHGAKLAIFYQILKSEFLIMLIERIYILGLVDKLLAKYEIIYYICSVIYLLYILYNRLADKLRELEL